METYIALLRGINVSGQKMIKMGDLIKALEELNFSNIRTYIQSGNIIFQCDKTDPSQLAVKIAGKISDHFRFEVPVVIRTLAELKQVSENNPFLVKRTEDVNKLHVTFLNKEPDPGDLRKAEENSFLPDEFIVSGKEVYLFCPNGYGRTKLTNTFFENKLKSTATTRNWKTIRQLLVM
jgi:uncharacterized protein (DUF1697 family)